VWATNRGEPRYLGCYEGESIFQTRDDFTPRRQEEGKVLSVIQRAADADTRLLSGVHKDKFTDKPKDWIVVQGV
jgi:hypothetical protein